MAELAALGLAVNVLQLVESGIYVVRRLREFQSLLPKGEDPEPYRTIRVELPLLLDILKRTKDQAESGQLSEDTQHALLPVVLGCHEQIKQLEELLNDLPVVTDSVWKRGVKGVGAVKNEKRFREVVNTLKVNSLQLSIRKVVVLTISDTRKYRATYKS